MNEYPENLTQRQTETLRHPDRAREGKSHRDGYSKKTRSSWLKIYCSLPLFSISWDAVLLDGARALVVLVGGVGVVPIVLIGGKAAQHEVAQVVFGDDPRGPSSIQGH